MKHLFLLATTMPLLILGTTLALLMHGQSGNASMIIDSAQQPPIALVSVFPDSDDTLRTNGSAGASARNITLLESYCSIRSELLCWALEKLPVAEPILLSRYTLQTTAVLLFGLGLFGVSGFLRSLFRIH